MYDDNWSGASLSGGPPGLADSAWEAALHLLEAPFLRPKVFLFVDQEARSVDWEGLLEESATWSHGERLLSGARPADGRRGPQHQAARCHPR